MKKKKKKKSYAGFFLIISAMVLGILIVFLVAKSKTKIDVTGAEPDRNIAGSYPMPSELIEKDKLTYFAYTEIPDVIFNKINGVSFGADCPVTREDLRYMNVLYWGTDSKPHSGELIVNKAIAADISDIFYELYKASYPIESVKLIDEYGGNDEVSMTSNNTSCFNARKTPDGGDWSLHAYGLAVDINPKYNPYVAADGTILPVASEQFADRSKSFVMKVDEDDYAYQQFTQRGFVWGGSWDSIKDYQHFEKTIQ